MNSITFFLFFIPILALILLGLNLIFAPHNPYQEKSSTFECGFHSFLGQNRTQFNISFFVFGLLYLTFDLELVLALPGLININGIEGYGLSIFLIFFIMLTIGFAFELGKKALNIESRQTLPKSILFSSLGPMPLSDS
jgi:NADH-ubiquinone oxidoreductase chain 3